MVKLIRGVDEVSLRDLIEIQKTPGIRTAVTWFGAYPTRYGGGSVPWKGVKGNAFWKMAAKHGNLKSGLEKARGMAIKQKGSTGVALVIDDRTGEYKVLSMPAANMLIEAGHGRLVQTAARITPSMKRKLLTQAV